MFAVAGLAVVTLVVTYATTVDIWAAPLNTALLVLLAVRAQRTGAKVGSLEDMTMATGGSPEGDVVDTQRERLTNGHIVVYTVRARVIPGRDRKVTRSSDQPPFLPVA